MMLLGQALSAHGLDLLAVEPPLAAQVYATGFGAFDAIALPFLDEGAFHLGDHAGPR